jgi:hypothetical protein
MAYDKIIKLVEKLYDKTMENKIQWEQIFLEGGIYQASFPEFTIKIKQLNRGGDNFIIIQIYNSVGELIDEIDDADVQKENPDFVAYELMHDLFEKARRIAMGTDQAIDKIISALED